MNVEVERPPGPLLAVDPRIRRRRVEIRRAQGRRRLHVLVATLVVVSVAAVAWAVTRSSLLDVDRVRVTGADHTGAATVRDASLIRRGQALTDVDPARSAGIVEALPWVLRAEVTRHWPATVSIHVVERVAMVVTRDDAGSWAQVDASGRVLERAATPPPGLAVLDGVPPAGAPGSRLAAPATDPLLVATALPPALAPRVASVALTPTGVELRLEPQGVVVLGPAEEVEAKLGAALTVLGAVDGRSVGTLDVRIPATPVLTRR